MPRYLYKPKLFQYHIFIKKRRNSPSSFFHKATERPSSLKVDGDGSAAFRAGSATGLTTGACAVPLAFCWVGADGRSGRTGYIEGIGNCGPPDIHGFHIS